MFSDNLIEDYNGYWRCKGVLGGNVWLIKDDKVFALDTEGNGFLSTIPLHEASVYINQKLWFRTVRRKGFKITL
jgi:hypothetical protein